MKNSKLFVLRLPLAATALTVVICQGLTSAHAGLIKASPAPPSPFIEHPKALVSDPERTPFNKIARNPSHQAWARVQNYNRIVILPVNTRYLRYKSGSLSAVGERVAMEHGRPVPQIADYMHTSFEKAFAKGGKYHVVSKSGPGTLVLELALVELRPTNVAVNVVSTGAGAVVPGANFIGSMMSKGGIAMEGKLRNGQTGELLEEFTDREQDKTSFFSFRDFSPYAHNRRTIDDWAKEVEEMSRTPRTQKVHGAMAVTLNPF